MEKQVHFGIMGKSKEISQDIRKRIVDLHKSGSSLGAISRYLKVPRSSVQTIIRKYKQDGNVQPSYRSGRRRVLCPRDERALVRHVYINPRTKAKDLVKMMAEAGFKRREGTQKDKNSLKETFNKLGFQVRTEDNLTYTEISTVLQKVAADDHSHRSCFVCAILSHGNEDGIFARDNIFTLNWLVTFFSKSNCRSLAGKPKLFFIQACRGEQYDFGIETDGIPDSVQSLAPQTLKEEDMLYVYSTPPGYFAWRNSTKGSWFIQSLCKMLQDHGNKLELMQILTRVNRTVALEYQSCIGGKEIPCIISMLTKELYL